MKKKVLAVALAVALIAIMVSGTLAYFTDHDEVTNTFTVGSVKIDIYENNHITDTDKITFEKPLIPIVNVDNPRKDISYIAKAVEVKNSGLNDAYIRVHIAIPTELVGYLYLDLNETGWTRQADSTATVEGVAYTVFTYNCNAAVVPNGTTGLLLNGVYLGSDVDLQEDANGNLVFIRRNADGSVAATSAFVAHTKTDNGYTSNSVNILVASQAIQKEGFTDAAAALDAGFGAKNPWQ